MKVLADHVDVPQIQIIPIKVIQTVHHLNANIHILLVVEVARVLHILEITHNKEHQEIIVLECQDPGNYFK